MTLALVAVAWLLTYLLHSTMLLGGAWLLSAARVVRSAVAKDALWKVCLIGGIVTATVQSALPGASLGGRLWLPGVAAAHAAGPDAAAASAIAEPSRAPSISMAAPRAVPAPVASRSPASLSAAAGTADRSPASSGSRSPQPLTPSPVSSWPYLLLALWLLGAAGMLVRVAICRRRLTRQLRGRRPITDGPLPPMLETLSAAAGVRRRIRLTVSAELAGPVAMGTSEICLPERALTSLTPAEQRAALAHELGHLVRRDPVWLALSVASESVLFLQPLNRLARRRIQEAAEYLCDDWAVHQTGGGLTLARCLAEVATWIDARPRAVPVSGMAEHPSHLVARVQRLVEGARPRAGRGLRFAVPVAALALSTVAFAGPGVAPARDRPASATGDALAGPGAAAAVSTGAAGLDAVTSADAWPADSVVWATIRHGRLLVFRRGFGPRITGRGTLGLRRGGRAIELVDEQRLTVNGRAVGDDSDVAVLESDTLRIVDADGRSLWELAPQRLSPEQMAALDRRWPGGDDDLALQGLDSLKQAAELLEASGLEFDSGDVESLSRAAAELSESAGRIGAELAPELARLGANLNELQPQLARLRAASVRLGAELAPRVAAMGVRIAADVVPMIVDALGDSAVCDSVRRPTKHKSTFRPRR
jgi:beta-lactamase regulating signal transducer with metallopeptidase domain